MGERREARKTPLSLSCRSEGPARTGSNGVIVFAVLAVEPAPKGRNGPSGFIATPAATFSREAPRIVFIAGMRSWS
jgi:hypothetical protein